MKLIKYLKLILLIIVVTNVIAPREILCEITTIAQAQAGQMQSNGLAIVAGYAKIDNDIKGLVVRYSSDGSFDNSFGVSGVVKTLIGERTEFQSLTIQPSDQKIIAAGFAIENNITKLAVVRYEADGTLDTTFGDNNSGTIMQSIGDGVVANGIALQADGKIVVAGVSVQNGKPQFVVVRYDDQGVIDTSFADQGIALTEIEVHSNVAAVAIDSNTQKIVACGYCTNGINYQFATVRYNQDGSLDTSFGDNGILTTSVGSNARATSVYINSDSSILVAGVSDSSCALLKYDMFGVLDFNFGNSGIVVLTQESLSQFNGIQIKPDGKIVATGFSGSKLLIAQLLSDGSLDTTFNATGKALLVFENSNVGNAIISQADSKIIAIGYADKDFLLARYAVDGTLDITWGNQGVVCQPGRMGVGLITQICEQEPAGTNGGTFTAGSWQTRILNHMITSNGSIILNNNNFIIGPGRYSISVVAPAYKVGSHQIRLQNITDGTTDAWGSSVYSNNDNGSLTFSTLDATLFLTKSTTYSIEHRCSITQNNDGFGIATGFGNPEIYTIVKIIPR